VPVSILSLSLSWKLEGRIRLAVPLSCRVRRSYAFHVPCSLRLAYNRLPPRFASTFTIGDQPPQ